MVMMVMVVIVIMTWSWSMIVVVVVMQSGRAQSCSSSSASGFSSSSTETFFSAGLASSSDVVDDLVLEDRRAQLDQGRRVLLVDTRRRCAPGRDSGAPARSGRGAARPGSPGCCCFSPISPITRPSRTRRSAILRYSARSLLLGLALVREGLPGLLQRCAHLLPDALELAVHQRWRQREVVRLVERVEQLALQLHARDARR